MKQIFQVLSIVCGIVHSTSTFAQSVVINEFCPSNLYYTDEDNDTPDWLELYNTTDQSINLGGWYLSDKLSKPEMWAFPSVTLSSKAYLLIYASGKNRSQIMQYYPLVHYSDTFAYKVPDAQTSKTWKNPGFDDSSWARGKGGFGYGDNDDVTIVPDGTMSIYVRRHFEISDMSNISELLFDVDYDDGFVAYINGTEIARINMGDAGSAVTYNQAATATVEPLIINGSLPVRFSLTNFKDFLVEGANVLAIEVHNYASTSSDITLIPFLTANSSTPGPGTVDPLLNLVNGNLHTNFKISSEGEAIYLTSPDHVIVHQTDTLTVPSAASRGLKPDGSAKWYFFAEPTPGKANNTKGYETADMNPVQFSPKGGIYNSKVLVTLKAQTAGDIYYTTDGSEPSKQSTKYSQPIEVKNTKVIRAILVGTEQMPGQSVTESYIFPQHETTLPIVSLTTDPYNLWDYDYGIYADGPGWTSDNPHFGANYWMDWKRPVNIEYFLPEQGKLFEAPGGVGIFGAWSRANPQKSMALYADKSYGKKSFDYPFFNSKNITKFKSLVLRNSGNDWSSTVMRDAVMTGLVRNTNIDIQAYQPTVVYINGEYWGILNLREKINEDYLAANFAGVKADSVDIVQNDAEIVEGSAVEYNKMMSFINSNSMSKEANYEKVKTMMDMDEYLNYMVSQIYYDNRDWPGNNIKYWRPQTENAKWRWLMYDTDFGYGMYNSNAYSLNTLAFALEPNNTSWPNPAWSTLLLRRLVQSPVFVNEFANRFADRLNFEFESVTANDFIDSLSENIKTEIPYHIDRWQHIYNWAGNVTVLKTFASKRPVVAFQFVNSQFNLGGTNKLTLQNSDPNGGYVQVNSLTIKHFPWRGSYFAKVPVTLTAIARPGYKFVRWDTDLGTRQQIEITVTANVTVKAVFEPVTNGYNSIVINEINYKSANDFDTKDWVELFNTTGGTIDLSGWILNDAEGSKPFTLPKGTTIAPKGFLVICQNLADFRKYWPDVNTVVGEFQFGLGSIDEAVRLFDADNYLVDSVMYSSVDPWTDDPDGNGPTLSLIDPHKDNNEFYRWEGSKGHGTPGAQNDNYNDIPETVFNNEMTAYCYPNPFNEKTTLSWEQPFDENVRIELTDFQGRTIAVIEDKWYAKGKYELELGQLSKDLKPGFYLVNLQTGDAIIGLKLIKQ